jgi:hypothetical protein
MNKKQIHTIAMFAIVFGVAISPIITADNAEARLANIRYILHGDLTAPNNDKPFGGKDIGTYNIHIRDNGSTSIYVELDHRPSNGMKFEGWLIDIETGEKLSTGTFKESVKRGFFTGIAPEFHYDIFVVTEEPIIDSDPAPNKPVAGVPLSAPFGQ